MQRIKYQCRVEKKLTDHTIVKVSELLPAYTEVLQCLSCGVLGIVTLDKERAYNADI